MSKQKQTIFGRSALLAVSFVTLCGVIAPSYSFAVEGKAKSEETRDHDAVEATRDLRTLEMPAVKSRLINDFSQVLGKAALTTIEQGAMSRLVTTGRGQIGMLTVADAVTRGIANTSKAARKDLLKQLGDVSLQLVSRQTSIVDNDIKALDTLLEITVSYAEGEVTDAEAKKFLEVARRTKAHVEAGKSESVAFRMSLREAGYNDDEIIQKLLNCMFKKAII
jgi:hypothetical protein